MDNDQKIVDKKEKEKKEDIMEGDIVERKDEGPLKKEKSKTKNDHDVVWAIFMISIGVIFLMNSFGVLSWGIWSVLWRFWPVLLILGGIQLLLGKSVISKIVTAITAVVVINLVIFASILSMGGEMRNWMAGWMDEGLFNKLESWMENNDKQVNETISVSADDYEDVESRSLELNIGAAEFTVVSDQSFDDYLLVDSTYYEGFNEPVLEQSFENQELKLTFDTETNPSNWVGRFDKVIHDFTLGQTDIETNLEIDLGAGKGTVTFDELNLSDVKAYIGAGTLDFAFEEDSLPTGLITIDVGAGSARITLPEDVGVKVVYEVGAGSLTIGDEKVSGLGKDGTYETDGYDDAELQVELKVDIGAGKVEIIRG